MFEQIVRGNINDVENNFEQHPDKVKGGAMFPPELERIGIGEYREIHYKPYLIIYAVHGQAVVVHCVLDGRRDMQTLLQQRLLR